MAVKKILNKSFTISARIYKQIFSSDTTDFRLVSIILDAKSIDIYKKIVDESGVQKIYNANISNIITLKSESSLFKELKDKDVTYKFTVELVYEDKYKEFQFQMISFFEDIPKTDDEMVKFLAKKISSIGLKKAKDIVSHFGVNEVENIFNNDIKKLLEIKGIKESNLNSISESWSKNSIYFQIMDFLKDFNVPETVGLKIMNKYNNKSLEIIMEKPYKLCEIDGVSFISADKIAMGNGHKREDTLRIAYGLLYVMNKEINDTGNTILDLNKILTLSVNILAVDPSIVMGVINKLISKGSIKEIEKDRKITTKSIYSLEEDIYSNILDFVNLNDNNRFLSQNELDDFAEKNEFKLDKTQLDSVVSIMKNKINVLTGGPGTGKTHTIKSICITLMRKGFTVKLLAPTGKAAQRLSESTKIEAETLHRFLKIMPKKGDSDFMNDNDNNENEEVIKESLIIIDESSMLELSVVNILLKRINPLTTAILFVGDIDQLPPVGAGNFFGDIINSNLINVCRLGQLHRSDTDGIINQNAIKVKNKENIILENRKDFEFHDVRRNEDISTRVKEIYQSLIDSKVSNMDIQVLVPMKDVELGCNEMNSLLRPIGNKNFNSFDKPSKILVGDKVMQTVNNYELEVFNGDTGIVNDYNPSDDSTSVMFNNMSKIYNYDKQSLAELMLAYCITIHKSQGSDYQYVIIPLVGRHNRMWNRSLLYTAMTRTKTKLFLVGDMNILNEIHLPHKNPKRITNLIDFFNKLDKNEMHEEIIF